MAPQYCERELLNQFALSVFPSIEHFTELDGDASSRHYIRAHRLEGNVMLVDGRNEPDACQRFRQLSYLLTDCHLPVPEIYAFSDTSSILLIEDFGDQCLNVELESTPTKAMSQALILLAQWQKKTTSLQPQLPAYTKKILREELSRIEKWFFPHYLKIQLTSSETIKFEQDSQKLISLIQQIPVCAVHRDFHSRNLMRISTEKIGIIDYQDALWGAITYDLVSLTRDCYIRYPYALRQQWEQNFRAQHYPQISKDDWSQHCHAASLQRHIKVLGLFVRLAKEKQKTSYLRALPRVWTYALEESQALADDLPFIAEKLAQIDNQVKKQFVTLESQR